MDQCENFRSLGIAAEFIGEAQKDKRIIERVLNGDIQLVYISPESILTNLRYRQMLRSPQYMERLVAVAVDEAHLVKEWLALHSILYVLIYSMDIVLQG